MATKIRLKRFGNRNRPQWRIVVADSRSPRDGRFIEEIGYYNALPKQEEIQVKEDRLEYWTGTGAILSDAVKSLLKRKKRTAGSAS